MPGSTHRGRAGRDDGQQRHRVQLIRPVRVVREADQIQPDPLGQLGQLGDGDASFRRRLRVGAEQQGVTVVGHTSVSLKAGGQSSVLRGGVGVPWIRSEWAAKRRRPAFR
jgi:hypothetical protein